MPLAIDFPAPELILFAVAILIGVIGKVVAAARSVRRKSLESQETGDRVFGPLERNQAGRGFGGDSGPAVPIPPRILPFPASFPSPSLTVTLQPETATIHIGPRPPPATAAFSQTCWR